MRGSASEEESMKRNVNNAGLEGGTQQRQQELQRGQSCFNILRSKEAAPICSPRWDSTDSGTSYESREV